MFTKGFALEVRTEREKFDNGSIHNAENIYIVLKSINGKQLQNSIDVHCLHGMFDCPCTESDKAYYTKPVTSDLFDISNVKEELKELIDIPEYFMYEDHYPVGERRVLHATLVCYKKKEDKYALVSVKTDTKYPNRYKVVINPSDSYEKINIFKEE